MRFQVPVSIFSQSSVSTSAALPSSKPIPDLSPFNKASLEGFLGLGLAFSVSPRDTEGQPRAPRSLANTIVPERNPSRESWVSLTHLLTSSESLQT